MIIGLISEMTLTNHSRLINLLIKYILRLSKCTQPVYLVLALHMTSMITRLNSGIMGRNLVKATPRLRHANSGNKSEVIKGLLYRLTIVEFICKVLRRYSIKSEIKAQNQNRLSMITGPSLVEKSSVFVQTVDQSLSGSFLFIL